MKRREFVTLLGGAAAALPLSAWAQQPAMPVIGFLLPGSQAGQNVELAGVRHGLSDAGYVEDRNLSVEYRSADDHYDRLPALADELTRRNVGVIVAFNTAAAFAARAATKAIPIVFVTGTNPVEVGLVASLNKPDGNLTGVTLLFSEVMAKRIELLHELVPAATTIAFIVNPANPVNAGAEIKELQIAADALGVRLLVVNAGNESEFDSAFVTLVGEGARAVIVSGDVLFVSHTDRLVALAVRHRLPTIYPDRKGTAAGGLIAYGTDLGGAFRQVGVYAGRMLKGEKPSDLPIYQVTKIELVINLKTAKALELTVPLPLLGRADEVIE
jgi:putative tryptophan/tyrosine transport system substrate-binding protein